MITEDSRKRIEVVGSWTRKARSLNVGEVHWMGEGIRELQLEYYKG